jgi:hypothetical protein
MENKYLLWVKIASPILNVTALEQFIGIPFQSLHRYLDTGVFPPKHLALLREKLEPICRLEPAWIETYATHLMEEHEALVGFTRENVLEPNGLANAKQEQVLDDIAQLYLVLRAEDPPVAARVADMLTGRLPVFRSLISFLQQKAEGMGMQEIRNLPCNPTETAAV